MTDTNETLKMPPGFRWTPTFELLGSETAPTPTGYGYLESSTICTQPMAHTRKDAAIALAHTIVRPAVEAATAELRAELRKALEGVTEYASREAQARARAEKAEADLAAVVSAFSAASRGEGE